MDGNKLLSQVDCRYGAPMGRRTIKGDTGGRVRLFRVALDSGGYDRGGAYWGIGQPLYAVIGEDFQSFRRANNREQAKQLFLKDYPELKFYR